MDRAEGAERRDETGAGGARLSVGWGGEGEIRVFVRFGARRESGVGAVGTRVAPPTETSRPAAPVARNAHVAAVTAPYRSPGSFPGLLGSKEEGEFGRARRARAAVVRVIPFGTKVHVSRGALTRCRRRRGGDRRRDDVRVRRAVPRARALARRASRAPRVATRAVPAEGSTSRSAPSSSNRRDATRRPAPRRGNSAHERRRRRPPPARSPPRGLLRRPRRDGPDAADVIACARAAGVEWSDAQMAEDGQGQRRDGDAQGEPRRPSWACAARGSSRGGSDPRGGDASLRQTRGRRRARRPRGVRSVHGGRRFWKCARPTAALGLSASSGSTRREEGGGTTTTARTRCHAHDAQGGVRRELTRLMAGLTREEARRPAQDSRGEAAGGDAPQDYPATGPRSGGTRGEGRTAVAAGGRERRGFKMRNRIRGRGR